MPSCPGVEIQKAVSGPGVRCHAWANKYVAARVHSLCLECEDGRVQQFVEVTASRPLPGGCCLAGAEFDLRACHCALVAHASRGRVGVTIDAD